MTGRQALERLLQKLEQDRGHDHDQLDAETAYSAALYAVRHAIEEVLREDAAAGVPPSDEPQGAKQ